MGKIKKLVKSKSKIFAKIREKGSHKSNLIELSEQTVKYAESKNIKSLKKGMYLCQECYKFLYSQKVHSGMDIEKNAVEMDEISEGTFSENNMDDTDLVSINKILIILKMSEISKRDLRSKKQLTKCLDSVLSGIQKLFGLKTENETITMQDKDKSRKYEELTDVLVKGFETANQKEKLMILTLCPISWTIRFIANLFHTTTYLVAKGKSVGFLNNFQ
jgi:hypothetical protein